VKAKNSEAGLPCFAVRRTNHGSTAWGPSHGNIEKRIWPASLLAFNLATRGETPGVLTICIQNNIY